VPHLDDLRHRKAILQHGTIGGRGAVVDDNDAERDPLSKQGLGGTNAGPWLAPMDDDGNQRMLSHDETS
jgi:hypothetical protein